MKRAAEGSTKARQTWRRLAAIAASVALASAIAAASASAQSGDVELLLAPGTAVTAIYSGPGCPYPSKCSEIVSMANTVESRVAAVDAATNGDMARVQAALASVESGARDHLLARALAIFRASDQPTITTIIVRDVSGRGAVVASNGPAPKCPKQNHSAAFWKPHKWRATTRRAFTKICTTAVVNLCGVAARHDSETFWYNGDQAWGGQPNKVHGSDMSCQNSGVLGGDIVTDSILAVSNDSCDFEPNVASWHNPAFLSRGQHLSADDRFHGTAPIKGFGVSQYAHIYFWDYGNGYVCAHVGNEPII